MANMKEKGNISRQGIADLFEPDVLLPVQFFEIFRKKNDSRGERKLILAVLEDAIDCFQKYAHTNDLRGRELFREAFEWIMSCDKRWLFSFENICQIIDLNPDYIREGLKKWRTRESRAGQAEGISSESGQPPQFPQDVLSRVLKEQKARNALSMAGSVEAPSGEYFLGRINQGK